ncbi:hypothetical protein [Parvularcula maris]|uniref:Uncharacterized protein n=1 Tax=Parvularcula maris TaxID=2965077 RepID=A0A9X2L9M4_9PROT|nr:hypothetical protein [Parvularcula maris]MCQ8185663.1 hypothetical protein [Parvularcula maris]
MTITGPELVLIGALLVAFYVPLSFYVVRYEKRHQARKKSQD